MQLSNFLVTFKYVYICNFRIFFCLKIKQTYYYSTYKFVRRCVLSLVPRTYLNTQSNSEPHHCKVCGRGRRSQWQAQYVWCGRREILWKSSFWSCMILHGDLAKIMRRSLKGIAKRYFVFFSSQQTARSARSEESCGRLTSGNNEQ